MSLEQSLLKSAQGPMIFRLTRSIDMGCQQSLYELRLFACLPHDMVSVYMWWSLVIASHGKTRVYMSGCSGSLHAVSQDSSQTPPNSPPSIPDSNTPYGLDYGAPRWIYLLDPPGLGLEVALDS